MKPVSDSDHRRWSAPSVGATIVAAMLVCAPAEAHDGRSASVLISDGPALPSIDIRRACTAASTGDDSQSCIGSETYARANLVKHWNATPMDDKTRCLPFGFPPVGSYVALKGCITNYDILKITHQ